MARPTEEFLLAWDSLVAPGEGAGWRTISIGHAGPCALEAGRRFPGNEESILVSFSSVSLPSNAETLPEGQGFEVERVDPHGDGKTWLALNRKQSGSLEMFIAMARDVCGTLAAEAGSGEAHLLRIFLGRVRAWQEFMRKGAQILGPEAEVGLIGEISVLISIIKAGVAPARSLEAWVGPLDGIQDFELGAGAIEVKATVASAGFPARIGSLEQLDDSVRQPLFVLGERLSQCASGRRLPDFVSAARSLVAEDPEARRLLSERLLRAGYYDAHADRYSRRFDSAEARIIEVGDSFPRLIHGCVPRGVVRARYEIDLDHVPGKSISIVDALRRLGVL